MKAWVLHDIGDIRFQDIEMPVIKPGEVCIRVEAAGICGSDIPRIYETGAHRMPLVPGHEFAGTVDSVGEGVDKSLTGKRMGVFPLIPCGKCRPCMNGTPQLCESYDYVGSRRDGAFAEFVSVPAGNLIELPDSVSFTGAAMMEPMSVAVHAMRRALEAESTDRNIVICGLGTIGLLLLMFIRDAGYKNTFVICNKDPQREKALSLGVPGDMILNSKTCDVVSWLKSKGGADIYFECVGRNECVSYGVECGNAGAKIVLIGNPFSGVSLTRDVYWRILRKEMAVTGSWNSLFSPEGSINGRQDDWHYVLDRLKKGAVDPEGFITHRFQPDELDKGFTIMLDKTDYFCKVMMVRK